VVKVAFAGGLTVVALAALLLGPAAFSVLVLILAVVALVDISVLLSNAGARPVLPVALIPGLVLPALVAADVTGATGSGWDRIPAVFAGAFLLGFLLVLAFGRRAGSVMGLGATAVVSLLVGLGASSLILLRGLPHGFRWILAFGVLVLAADVAHPLVRAVAARREARFEAEDDLAGRAGPGSPSLQAVLPALVAVAVAGVILVVVLEAPHEPPAVALLALIAVVAALGGAHLHRSLSTEAGVETDRAHRGIGAGVAFGALDAVILGAPAAYVLARSIAL
jgi:CDP-diglyceride synthetase